MSDELEARLWKAQVMAKQKEIAELQDENKRLTAQIEAARPILTKLSVLGDEAWKTPGHPMNEWVSKETVQYQAKRALEALDATNQADADNAGEVYEQVGHFCRSCGQASFGAGSIRHVNACNERVGKVEPVYCKATQGGQE